MRIYDHDRKILHRLCIQRHEFIYVTMNDVDLHPCVPESAPCEKPEAPLDKAEQSWKPKPPPALVKYINVY